jgi:hypothetical protein
MLKSYLSRLWFHPEVVELYQSIFLEDTFKSKQKEFLRDTKDFEKKILQLKEKVNKIDMDFANGDISTSQFTRISSQLACDRNCS